MPRFHVEGMDFEEANAHIAENLDALTEDFDSGAMKAGRYIGLYYIMEAAKRSDCTSQIALGSMYELGIIVDRDPAAARYWYQLALAQDHPKADGSMLAAAAAEGLQRLNGDTEST